MADVGLTAAVKALLQDDLPEDLTIKVEKNEFRVHKEVMASVSDYFRAMFTRGMVESRKDIIKLKDINPDTMSKLITFIYTGNKEIVNTDAREILALAVYFQMPTVIEVCIEKLLDTLCIENCLELLHGFGAFALDDGVLSIHAFLKKNLSQVIEHYDKKRIPFEVMQSILDLWQEAEWDAFVLVKDWVCVDYENRKQHLNDLMSQVRFCLMPKAKLKAVKQMDVYTEAVGDESWQGLVQKAIVYQKIPIHLKVLDKSEQSEVRSDASPVFFTTGKLEHPATFFSLDEDNMWKTYEKKARYSPDFTKWYPDDRPVAVTVNNFLVACTRLIENDWYIFNPRTLAWSRIASIAKPKMEISLAHHGQYVYCVGGYHFDKYHASTHSHKLEQYCLQTNTWTSIDAPARFTSPGVCVVGDLLYVCGSEAMWALDCMSLQWQRKASPLEHHQHHTMHHLRFHGDDGLVILTPTWEIDFYSLALDQWSLVRFKFKLAFDCVDGGPECIEMTAGNAIYRMNVIGRKDTGRNSILPPDAPFYDPGVCVIWKFSEDGNEAVEEVLDEFPIFNEDWTHRAIEPFGAMLAIPKYR